MGTCISNKKIYSSLTLAEEALIDAHIRYDYGNGAGPVSVYKCHDCGHYHLTSKGPMNARLATLMADGQIKRQQEANRWLDKLGN